MAARVAGSQGVAARVWLAGGGVSMGIGVWAMHFIGMLAMDLSMSMSYNAALPGRSSGSKRCYAGSIPNRDYSPPTCFYRWQRKQG
ncbi:MHYT domain-containing protein [Enterobacter hormaechei]